MIGRLVRHLCCILPFLFFVTFSASADSVGLPDSTTVDQSTHDNLNGNANIQVGNADVANGNPVPVSDAGGTLTVDGALTCNAGTDLNTSALATSANQSTIIGHVDGIEGLLTTIESNQLADNHQVTCNAGTDLDTSALALESGGNLDTIAGVVRNEATTGSGIQSGVLGLAQYVASPPAFFSDTIAALRLDDNGQLMVGGTVSASVTGSVSIAGSDPGGCTLISANGGTATLNWMSGGGGNTVGVYLNSSFDSGDTIVFEQSVDSGTTWISINALDYEAGDGVPLSSVSGDSTSRIFIIPHVLPYANYRVRATAFNSSFCVDIKIAGLTSTTTTLPIAPGANLIGGATSYIGSSVADGGAGNISSATQRIAVATDDVNLSAMKSSLDTLDSVDYAKESGGNLDAIAASLAAIDEITDSLHTVYTGFLGVLYTEQLAQGTSLDTLTGAVSGSEFQADIVSSALPSGAATAANQSIIADYLSGLTSPLTDTCATWSTSDGNIIAAPGSGDHIYVHHISVQNSDDTNDVKFQIRKGSAGARVRDWTLTPYQAIEINLNHPIDIGDNVALYYDYEAGTTPDLQICVQYEIVTP